MSTTPEDLEFHLREEGNRAIAGATRYTTLLGVVGTLGIGLNRLAGAPADLDVALAASIWGALTSAVLWQLASRRQLHGPMVYPVFSVYASLPTFLFVASQLLLDSGAAAFILGPMGFLYCVLIALSGCLLRPWLPVVVGIVTALSFYGCSELARPTLLLLQGPHETVLQELSRFAWINRALMLVFTGLVTSVLTLVARRLAVAVREEAAEQDRVRRIFGQYVSDEVAAHVLEEGGQREGQRQEVVVLFSDIRGFTTFSETAAPDELVARLNAYFDAMVAAIHAHGGTVDKFIGDAVMAVFGGVLPHENPSDGALNAAEAMQQALARLNAGWEQQGWEPWKTGIGIHRGEVVIGSIGSEARRDFTVLGDAVNTASRLEGITKELGAPVLVSEAVRAGLSDPSRVSSMGTVPIRGRTAELAVYRL